MGLPGKRCIVLYTLKCKIVKKLKILLRKLILRLFHIYKNNIKVDKFIGFLKTISLNILRDKWRKSKRQGSIVNFDNINPESASVEDCTEDMAQREVIQNALKLLNEEQRTVIELRILKGFSVEDTARQMNKKEGNIRVLQYRALQNLTKILKDEH